jgi:hypothetical protein
MMPVEPNVSETPDAPRSTNTSVQKVKVADAPANGLKQAQVNDYQSAVPKFKEPTAPKFNNKIYMNSKIDNVIDKEFVPIQSMIYNPFFAHTHN